MLSIAEFLRVMKFEYAPSFITPECNTNLAEP